MKYHHQFQVPASIERVVEFHTRSENMAAIAPPPIKVQVHQAPPLLTDGDKMEFTIWLGPLPVHWLAQIESMSDTGFTDRQLRGPFANWVHQHLFRVLDVNNTEVTDEITFQLQSHPVWWLIGLGFWFGMPILFAFRAWKTKGCSHEYFTWQTLAPSSGE